MRLSPPSFCGAYHTLLMSMPSLDGKTEQVYPVLSDRNILNFKQVITAQLYYGIYIHIYDTYTYIHLLRTHTYIRIDNH